MKIPIQQPLMRTEAEQLEINQKRLEAELYQMKLIASQQAQHLQVANFVGASMQRQEQKQPHVTYNVYSGGGPPLLLHHLQCLWPWTQSSKLKQWSGDSERRGNSLNKSCTKPQHLPNKR